LELADQPRTLWSDAAPNEYGFYSNVNPTCASALVASQRTPHRRDKPPADVGV
jgi:DMSO/TMAO reductase YedYZ molybdopterin-dependent catalytic subunit